MSDGQAEWESLAAQGAIPESWIDNPRRLFRHSRLGERSFPSAHVGRLIAAEPEWFASVEAIIRECGCEKFVWMEPGMSALYPQTRYKLARSNERQIAQGRNDKRDAALPRLAWLFAAIDVFDRDWTRMCIPSWRVESMDRYYENPHVPLSFGIVRSHPIETEEYGRLVRIYENYDGAKLRFVWHFETSQWRLWKGLITRTVDGPMRSQWTIEDA